MKINCLCCGFKLDLDESYDNYEGQVKCYTCGTLLDVKIDQGGIKAVKVVTLVPPLSMNPVSNQRYESSA